MIFGAILIVAGILIAVFPQLLAFIVAIVLIMFGFGLIATSVSYRKAVKESREGAHTSLFIRF
jgi:uncharacterized membrane protein